jgi:diguanylate cyclase (GGDEF)-like protein
MYKMNRTLFFKNSIAALGAVLSFVIFYIDFKVLGPEITFTLLYLFPIVTVTWFSGLRYGIFLSLLSLAEWSYIQLHNFQNANIVIFGLNCFLKVSIFIFIIVILSRLKIRISTERMYANHDYLTGALNRKGFYEVLGTEIYRAKRSNSSLALAYFDIDNFKKINDIFGHDAGDEVLVHLARMIAPIIRKTDVLVRIGGDEFIVLFPDTGIRDSRKAIIKIKTEFGKITDQRKWPVSLSVGVGVFKGKFLDRRKMMTLADQLMYTVKKGQKNGALFHEYK